MHSLLYLLIGLTLLLGVNSCSKKTPTSNDRSKNITFSGPLDPPDYNKLSAQNKYKVVDKLLSTLYKGIAPEDFFTISDKIEPLKPKYEGNYLDKIRAELEKPLNPADKYAIIQRINERYEFTENKITTICGWPTFFQTQYYSPPH